MKIYFSTLALVGAISVFIGVNAQAKPKAGNTPVAKSVTCELRRVGSGNDPSFVQATISEDSGGDYTDSDGINVGKLNYSFGIRFDEEDLNVVDVIFYENNRTEDEVGSLSFQLDGTSNKFEEDITGDNDELILKLTCWENL